MYKFGSKRDWRKVGVPTDFVCDHVDLCFKDSDRQELLTTAKKEKISDLLSNAKFMTKTRKFSNAFRKCDFCGQEISLDTKNHTMSCSGVGTPIMTPSAKRIKLTSLNLESNEFSGNLQFSMKPPIQSGPSASGPCRPGS